MAGSARASCPGFSSQSNTFVPPSNGITGGYTGEDPTILRAMVAFSAIAWYNSIELIFLVLFGFKKHEGLYFWSLLITSLAIIVYQVGSFGNMFQIAGTCYPDVISVVTLQNIGWIVMVVGQSLVLYSRLHIIVIGNKKLLDFVLWMIIVNGIVLYIPTTTLNYGTIVKMTKPYIDGYNVVERIQMTLFSLQEIIISGIYLWEVKKFLKIWEGAVGKLMVELIVVNVCLILLDVALLSVEFKDLYMIETTLKGMVYSIKLKLEWGVLSKMVKVVELRQKERTMDSPDDFVLGNFSSTPTARDIPAERAEPDDFASTNSQESPRIEPGATRSQRLNSVQNPDLIPQHNHDDNFPSARSEPSRQSSIQDMYPGRIPG